MINSKQIQTKQNEEKMLQTQFAARVCFNYAEKLHILIWLFVIISVSCFFLPECVPEYVRGGIAFVSDLVVFFLCKARDRHVLMGARLRNYFDSEVLSINASDLSKEDVRNLKERVHYICSKNPSEMEIQVNNSGFDNPPGVRDWYQCLSADNDENAQLSCQSENIWWNKKMYKIRILIYSVMFITFLLGFLLFYKLHHFNLISFMLCLAGFFGHLWDRIDANIKYFCISNEIDGAFKVVEQEPSDASIGILQNLIEKRREIPVLELNIVHEKWAKKLSAIYEDISGE